MDKGASAPQTGLSSPTEPASGLGDPSRMETAIKAALAKRKAELDRCPVRKGGFGDKPCPECKATTAGPCWINIGADAAFVDAIKELLP